MPLPLECKIIQGIPLVISKCVQKVPSSGNPIPKNPSDNPKKLLKLSSHHQKGKTEKLFQKLNLKRDENPKKSENFQMSCRKKKEKLEEKLLKIEEN